MQDETILTGVDDATHYSSNHQNIIGMTSNNALDIVSLLVNILYFLNVVSVLFRWCLPSTQLEALEVVLKTTQKEIDVHMERIDNDAAYADICLAWKKYVMLFFINPFRCALLMYSSLGFHLQLTHRIRWDVLASPYGNYPLSRDC